MASAHGFSRSLRLVELRAPAPLALPAPPGHVPQPLPAPTVPLRRRRSALPMLWGLLAASFFGFLSATTLIDHTGGGGSQEFVHAVPLGTLGASTSGDGGLRSLRTSLARMIIPAAAPPTPRSVLPPDIREAGLAAPIERDDTTLSLAGLVASLNAPAVDVGPFGEALPPEPTSAPSPATATWTGAIGGVPLVAALPPSTANVPSLPEPGDESEEDESISTQLPPGAAPPPPPAAPRLRTAPRQNEPRPPRITMRQDAPPAGGGARLIHPPPPSRTASIGPTIPLPPLPEPRTVGVARPVPPPDGFASQVAATTPAAGAPWMRFARPFDRNDVRPRIAVVVIDLGLTPAPTDQAIHTLPGPVTLAFSPFADGLPRWVELARRAGHEVLMHLPLESPTAAAAGGEAPAAPAPGAENLGRLEWALNRATGHVGVASFMNFAGGEPALRPILTTLRDRGFLYVDRQGGARATSTRLASELGIPRASADREIDAEPTREAIDQRLAELERMARDTGTAVAIARPLAISFERLSIWSTTLETKGIALAPITAVLNRQRNR